MRTQGFLGLITTLAVISSMGCSNTPIDAVTASGGTAAGGAAAATGGPGAGGVAGRDANGGVAGAPQGGGEIGSAGMAGTGGISSSGGTPSTGSGTCTAPPCLVTLVSGQPYIREIAVNANGVHWIESTGANSFAPGQGDGRVMKVPLGGGPPVTLASEQDRPRYLQLDSTNVYWTTVWVINLALPRDGRSAVMAVPSSGGEAATVVSMFLEPDMFSNLEYVDFVVTASGAYWACKGTYDSQYYRDGFLLKVSLLDGTTTTLASGLLNLWGLAVDASNVYWRSNYTGDKEPAQLKKMPLDGGAITTVDLGPAPVSSVLHAGSLYWTNPGAGTVMKNPLDGSTPITLAAGRIGLDELILADTDSLYWTEGRGSALMKVPLQGGTPTTLVTGQSINAPMAVDSTSVYWTVPARGALMKLTPK